jgi:hypothetical protein
MRSTAPAALPAPYANVVDSLDKGVPPEDIRNHLVAAGRTPQQAKEIVEYACRWRKAYSGDNTEPSPNEPAGVRRSGQGKQIMGVFMLLVALAITAATIMFARPSGGPIIVFGTLITGGLALILHGSNQVAQARLMEQQDANANGRE